MEIVKPTNLKNIEGKVFNHLTALKYAGRNKHKKTLWAFSCKCGTIKTIVGYHVVSGAIKSCGCHAKEKAKKTGKANRKYTNNPGYLIQHLKYLINSYKNSAKKRKLVFGLSKDEFKTLVSSNCHYCGSVPRLKRKILNNPIDYLYNTIDRVDSCKGYTKDNCVPCCYYCNIAKSDLTYSEFLNHIAKIYYYHFNKIDSFKKLFNIIEKSNNDRY